jgi:hypothetical protein
MTENYEVEAVVDRRVVSRGGRYVREYLTKWKNYSHNKNTWEPVEHFCGSGKIEEFEALWQAEIAKALTRRFAEIVTREIVNLQLTLT